jgi:hypothetical protein
MITNIFRVHEIHFTRQSNRSEAPNFFSAQKKLTMKPKRQWESKFRVCKSVDHRTSQIYHQPDATIFQFIILTFICSSTCFGRCPAHHRELNNCSGSLWFYLRIVVTVVLCSWSFVSWSQSCCTHGRSGRPARPRAQHDCHHDTKVKPEAATAVIELMMMGGKTPETCWAVNKRQDNKLENCCIWLVIYLDNESPCCITFLLLPTWYTNFLFIHTNYILMISGLRSKHIEEFNLM